MKNRLLLLALLFIPFIGFSQVGVRSADTALVATVGGTQQAWKSKNYYNNAFARQNLLFGYATPQQYGALGDGVNDDTDAINACLLANLNVRFYGTYKTSSELLIRANQKVYSDNSTIINITTSTSIVKANDVNGWQISGRMRIQGNGKANSTAIGIEIVGCREFDVSGIVVSGVPGHGIFVKSGSDVLPRGQGGFISECQVINNWTGIEFAYGPESEYNTVTNLNATGNKYGMVIAAGNVTVTSGNIVDNENGIYIGDLINTNNSHGIINGVNVNHNTGYNLKLVGVQYGQTFQGCHFYGSSGQNIDIQDSYGATFTGCIIDGKIDNQDGNTPKGFHFFNGCQIEPSTSVTGYTQGLFFQRCFTKEGGMWSGNTVDYVELNPSAQQTGSIWISGNSIFGAQVKSDTFISRSFSSTFSPSNDITGLFRALSNKVEIASSYDVNGSYQPLTFSTSDLERFRIGVDGNSSFYGGLQVQSAPTNPTDVVRLQDLSSSANLSVGTKTASSFSIANTGGTGVVMPMATSNFSGMMAAADKQKLDGVSPSSSGTYNPTFTNVSNTSSITNVKAYFLRVGNIIQVTAKFNAVPVDGNDIQLTMTLPTATTYASISDVIGVIQAYGTTAPPSNPAGSGSVNAFNPSGTITTCIVAAPNFSLSGTAYAVSFTYEVK